MFANNLSEVIDSIVSKNKSSTNMPAFSEVFIPDLYIYVSVCRDNAAYDKFLDVN